MSLSKHQETKLEAEKFEKTLDAEIAHLDDLMKSPKKMTVMAMKTVTTEKAVDMEMKLIKESGLLLLKFNGLHKEFKINLFDKLIDLSLNWVFGCRMDCLLGSACFISFRRCFNVEL